MKRIITCFLLALSIGLFAQDNQVEMNKYNELHRPYIGYSLHMNIKSISLVKLSVPGQQTLGKIMYPVTNQCEILIENNSYSIDTRDENLSQKTNESLLLLLKYLGPFWYSNILVEESKLVTTKNSKVFSYDYEYKGENCINKYTFGNEKLENIEVFIKGNDMPSVVTKYDIIQYMGKNYLNGFQSDNTKNPNKLICRVFYKTIDDFLLPKSILMQTEGNNSCFQYNYEIESSISR
jgi:hypothetical protein